MRSSSKLTPFPTITTTIGARTRPWPCSQAATDKPECRRNTDRSDDRVLVGSGDDFCRLLQEREHRATRCSSATEATVRTQRRDTVPMRWVGGGAPGTPGLGEDRLQSARDRVPERTRRMQRDDRHPPQRARLRPRVHTPLRLPTPPVTIPTCHDGPGEMADRAGLFPQRPAGFTVDVAAGLAEEGPLGLRVRRCGQGGRRQGLMGTEGLGPAGQARAGTPSQDPSEQRRPRDELKGLTSRVGLDVRFVACHGCTVVFGRVARAGDSFMQSHRAARSIQVLAVLVAAGMAGCTEQDYKIGKVQTGAGIRPASASRRAPSTSAD